jgi:hypothetical protein
VLALYRICIADLWTSASHERDSETTLISLIYSIVSISSLNHVISSSKLSTSTLQTTPPVEVPPPQTKLNPSIIAKLQECAIILRIDRANPAPLLGKD